MRLALLEPLEAHRDPAGSGYQARVTAGQMDVLAASLVLDVHHVSVVLAAHPRGPQDSLVIVCDGWVLEDRGAGLQGPGLPVAVEPQAPCAAVELGPGEGGPGCYGEARELLGAGSVRDAHVAGTALDQVKGWSHGEVRVDPVLVGHAGQQCRLDILPLTVGVHVGDETLVDVVHADRGHSPPVVRASQVALESIL